MKKRKYVLAIAMVLAMAMGVTACSSGEKETAATEKATEAATTKAAETTAEETTTEAEREEDYLDGTVVSADDKTLTMKSIEEEEVSFDISNAVVNSDFPLGEGDEVSVHFYVDEAAEKQEAIEVDVNYSAAEEDYEGDAVITGVVENMGDSTITVKDSTDDQSYTFSTEIAQMVTGTKGIVVGDEIQLTYLGDVGDEEYPGLAVKVVTADMYDSDEAKLNTLTGVAISLGEGTLDLETPDGNIFNFVEAGADFSMTSEGDEVTIIYEGSLGGHQIKAVGME
ncbi:MAG: hypothetical protein ACOX8K_09770 [Lachnospiraceae bacterium]|jgi:hypothetical protein